MHFQLGCKYVALYVLLSNISNVIGKWDDIQNVRKLMKGIGIQNSPGQTCICFVHMIHSQTKEEYLYRAGEIVWGDWGGWVFYNSRF